MTPAAEGQSHDSGRHSPPRLCWKDAPLPFLHDRTRGRCINEWAWLCSSKTYRIDTKMKCHRIFTL